MASINYIRNYDLYLYYKKFYRSIYYKRSNPKSIGVTNAQVRPFGYGVNFINYNNYSSSSRHIGKNYFKRNNQYYRYIGY